MDTPDGLDRAAAKYDAGRAAFDEGDLERALAHLQGSLELDVHFKTLELIGEILCLLGRPSAAIVPLAAATTLNRGSRAPCLLAEAFLAMERWNDAEAAACESLRRTPGYRRAESALTRARSHTKSPAPEGPAI